MNEIAEMIQNETNKFIERFDDEVISYLKSLGYRPKKTAEYMKSLGKRLKRKGLYLCVEPLQEINGMYRVTMGYKIYLKEIKELNL